MSIPNSPWSLLYQTNVMGIISKHFFIEYLFKKAITLITVLSNCFNWRLFFLNSGLLVFSWTLLKWHHFRCQLACEKICHSTLFFLWSWWMYLLHIFRRFLLEGLCFLNFLFFCNIPPEYLSFCSLNIFFPEPNIYSSFFRVPCHNICIWSHTW